MTSCFFLFSYSFGDLDLRPTIKGTKAEVLDCFLGSKNVFSGFWKVMRWLLILLLLCHRSIPVLVVSLLPHGVLLLQTAL